jgi:hypothetical protein
VWDRYGFLFRDESEWGRDPRASFVRDLRTMIGASYHLDYLVDEIGVTRRR